MDNFKEASRLKLRFSTVRGTLSTEQLWDLDVSELDSLVVALNDACESIANRKSFRKSAVSVKSVKTQLAFDVALEILQTKEAEEIAAAQAQEIKAHNQAILQRMAANNEKELDKLSNEELAKLLK